MYKLSFHQQCNFPIQGKNSREGDGGGQCICGTFSLRLLFFKFNFYANILLYNIFIRFVDISRLERSCRNSGITFLNQKKTNPKKKVGNKIWLQKNRNELNKNLVTFLGNSKLIGSWLILMILIAVNEFENKNIFRPIFLSETSDS